MFGSVIGLVTMHFTIIPPIGQIATIAVGRKIREIDRLRRVYGPAKWRKRKGIAHVRIGSGLPFKAEVHWYEAQGIGRKELKVKRILEDEG
jgi:hypothetical protein